MLFISFTFFKSGKTLENNATSKNSCATAVFVDRSVHRRQKPLATDVALPEPLAGVHGVGYRGVPWSLL